MVPRSYLFAAALALVPLVSGCGGDDNPSAKDICNRMVDTVCDKAIACDEEADMTLSQCKAFVKAMLECDTLKQEDLEADCGEGQKLDYGKLDKCMKDTKALSCEEFLEGDGYASSCDNICS